MGIIEVDFDVDNMSTPYDKYPEMYSWMRENMEGHFVCSEKTCSTMLFELEEDAMAFKLMWR